MKKTYLGLMGLFLLPQTAMAVDAAAPASTSVSSPLAALWRVLLTPITVPHLPWAAAAAGPRCAGAGAAAADLLPVGSPWRLSPWLPGGGTCGDAPDGP